MRINPSLKPYNDFDEFQLNANKIGPVPNMMKINDSMVQPMKKGMMVGEHNKKLTMMKKGESILGLGNDR